MLLFVDFLPVHTVSRPLKDAGEFAVGSHLPSLKGLSIQRSHEFLLRAKSPMAPLRVSTTKSEWLPDDPTAFVPTRLWKLPFITTWDDSRNQNRPTDSAEEAFFLHLVHGVLLHPRHEVHFLLRQFPKPLVIVVAAADCQDRARSDPQSASHLDLA